jgi:hypothetical protein
MRPIVMVKQFHKLFRTVEFDLFGFLNLKLLIFEVDISTENFKEFELGKTTVVDNVENPDGWGLPVSGSAKLCAYWIKLKTLTCGVHLPAIHLSEAVCYRRSKI